MSWPNLPQPVNFTILHRQNDRTEVYLITGHCGLKKHLHTIRESSTSSCSCSLALGTDRIGLFMAAGPELARFCRPGTGGFRLKYKAAGSCWILPENLNLYSYFYTFVIIMWNYTIK